MIDDRIGWTDGDFELVEPEQFMAVGQPRDSGTKFKVVERTTHEIDGLSKPINVAASEVTQDA